MTIQVKVAQVPGSIREFALNDGAKVSDALREAGINATGKQIKLNGRDADANTTLPSGSSTVMVTAKITGNQQEDQALVDALTDYALNGQLCNNETHNHGASA